MATPTSRLSSSVRASLRCPRCGGLLADEAVELRCCTAQCATRYPIVDGVPILIAEDRSVFDHADFLQRRTTFHRQAAPTRGRFAALVPRVGQSLNSRENYRRLADLLLAESDRPRVLVIGAGVEGSHSIAALRRQGLEIVETDVDLNLRIALVCDGHDLPFATGTFDAVVAQAVLEHVLDPHRCVEEMHRVLRADGLVFAETPFMQQVHGGRYDFQRFTHLGHRRLFRHFEELGSGAVSGPGSALGWSYVYFLRSFGTNPRQRALASLVARLTGFWLKWFDRLLLTRPAGLDAACGLYFLGRRSERTLSDRELLQQFRGAS